jgi:excisionase family DNA binding protein
MQREPTPEPLALLKGVPAIADYLGLPRRTIYAALESGRLPATKLGKSWVASPEKLAKHFGIERGAA